MGHENSDGYEDYGQKQEGVKKDVAYLVHGKNPSMLKFGVITDTPISAPLASHQR